MTPRIGVPALIAIACACEVVASTARAGLDPIIKVDVHKDAEYRRILAAKLGPTPFDCGRVIVHVFPAPEYSVSVYTVPGSREHKVTFIAAKKSLWMHRSSFESAMSVKARRIDANIPAKLAGKLRNVYERVLSNVRQGEPPERLWEAIPKDNFDFEWSLEQAERRVLRGRWNNYKSSVPVRTEDFMSASAFLLKDYCEAKPARRPIIAKRIEALLAALLEHQ